MHKTYSNYKLKSLCLQSKTSGFQNGEKIDEWGILSKGRALH